MIDIPIGKALVAVEAPMLDKHASCFFSGFYPGLKCNLLLACMPITRQDGKDVIFKLVDLREEYNRGYADGHAACSGEVEL